MRSGGVTDPRADTTAYGLRCPELGPGKHDFVTLADYEALLADAARVAQLEAHLEMNLAAGVREQKLRDVLHARVAALETALREIADVVHVVKVAPDGHPQILVRRPEAALDEAVRIARAALAAPAPAEEQVGLDGPFEMETPAAEETA